MKINLEGDWPLQAASHRGEIPGLHFLVIYGQLEEQQQSPSLSMAGLAAIACEYWKIKKIKTVSVWSAPGLGERSEQLFLRRVALSDSETISALATADRFHYHSLFEHGRGKESEAGVDYLINGSCYSGVGSMGPYGEYGHRPFFELKVRIDFRTQKNEVVHQLTMELLELAARSFPIAHGAAEIVYGPSVGWGSAYCNDGHAPMELDRHIDAVRWGKVSDPCAQLYRVGYVTLMNKHLFSQLDERSGGGTIEWYNKYKPWAISRNHVKKLSDDLYAFVAGENPAEYLGSHVGTCQTVTSTHLAVAMLKSRLRSANLLL